VDNYYLSLTDELILLLSVQSLNFRSIKEVLNKFGYDNDKVIWSTLERLIGRGLIKKSKTIEGLTFSLTNTGLKSVPKEPTFIPTPDKAWDKKWRLVIFDIPEKRRKNRNQFTALLKDMHLAKLQNSIYITVHDILDEIERIAIKLDIKDFVSTMIVEKINVPDSKKFANKIWHLDDLKQKYAQFVEENRNGYTKGDFNSTILRYWLRRTKYIYLSILHEDPVLPKELLPSDWIGYEAQKIWNQIAKILDTY